MLGLLFMVAICSLVGWIVTLMIGAAGGVAVGILLFVLWFRFNKRQATTGLYKANLISYFHFRKQGESVDAALQAMVNARYRFFAKELDAVQAVLSQIPKTETDDVKVTESIFRVFCMENGEPPDPMTYRNAIRKLYRSFSQQYGLS